MTFVVYAWDPEGDLGLGTRGRWRWHWTGRSPFVALYRFIRMRALTGGASLDWTS